MLESADQPGHEPSPLTKVGYSVRPGPRVSQPPGQPERHWSANHVHAALSRPAGPARKQAAAKGRPVVSVPEGSRPRAGQVTPACPWAGAATHKHADTIQLVVRPESRVGAQRHPARSPQPAAGEVPIQVPTKRRSPSVLYRRQQQPRRAMERVRRSRTSAQSDLCEVCSAISGRAQWQI